MSSSRIEFLDFMKFKNMSERTLASYTNALIKLSQFYNAPPQKISADQIANFINHLSQVKKRTFSTCNVYLSAFKLLYNEFLDEPQLRINLPPRKTPKKLPVILATEEVEAVFTAETDARARTLLMTAYGTGVRVSELINLKVSDIDSQRKTVRIDQGKGQKDRYTLLPERLLYELRNYYTFYHPVSYLFYGKHMQQKLSKSMPSVAFKRAKKKAGITKTGGIHTLRHSFATHLYESGVDIKVIQELLGHRDISTTAIYIKVSDNHFRKVISPLDRTLTKTQMPFSPFDAKKKGGRR